MRCSTRPQQPRHVPVGEPYALPNACKRYTITEREKRACIEKIKNADRQPAVNYSVESLGTARINGLIAHSIYASLW